jgi:DNA (cytosine-5)-methyltransferase 1
MTGTPRPTPPAPRATASAYYNEIDPYCCRVLRKQIAAGNLPAGDVDERDIREVTPDDLRGYRQVHLFAGIGGIPLGLRMAGVPDDFDIWTGGFPCQDISNAGKRAGIDGERSGLWSEYVRLVRALRPEYLLVENVAALLVRGLDRVLGDLAACGYDAEWDCLPAANFGAPHRRDRIFLVAYHHRDTNPHILRASPGGLDAEDFRWWRGRLHELGASDGVQRGDTYAGIRREVDGIPDWVDRLRGLGNAVIPQQAQFIGAALLRHIEGRVAA